MTRENGKCHDALFAIALCYVGAKDLLWGNANDAKHGYALRQLISENAAKRATVLPYLREFHHAQHHKAHN